MNHPGPSRDRTENTILDGQGFAIQNIYMELEEEVYGTGRGDTAPFFSLLNDSLIKNLYIENVNITADREVGGLLAHLDESVVDNVHVSGTVNGWFSVGGLVGEMGGGAIRNSSMSGEVNTVGYEGAGGSGGDVGGIVGLVFAGMIEDTDNLARINGNDSGNIGGIAGMMHTGTINRSRSLGSVSGDDYVGGIAGYIHNHPEILNSYSVGSITGDDYVGGITGIAGSTIINSLAIGNISGDRNVGGVSGRLSSPGGLMENSLHIGVVSGGGSRVGGLVGNGWEGCAINSYWDTDTSGQSSSPCGEGKTTNVMLDVDVSDPDRTVYENWDISVPVEGEEVTTVWKKISPNHYPCLAWMDDDQCVEAEPLDQNTFGACFDSSLSFDIQRIKPVSDFFDACQDKPRVTVNSMYPQEGYNFMLLVNHAADGGYTHTFEREDLNGGRTSLYEVPAADEFLLHLFFDEVSGHYIIAGKNRLTQKVKLTKITSEGLVVWSQEYEHDYGEISNLYSVIKTESGYAVFGKSHVDPTPGESPNQDWRQDVVVFFINEEGGFIGTPVYHEIGQSTLIGDVRETNGGYVLVGLTDRDLFDSDPSGLGGFFLKVDAQGQALFNRFYDESVEDLHGISSIEESLSGQGFIALSGENILWLSESGVLNGSLVFPGTILNHVMASPGGYLVQGVELIATPATDQSHVHHVPKMYRLDESGAILFESDISSDFVNAESSIHGSYLHQSAWIQKGVGYYIVKDTFHCEASMLTPHISLDNIYVRIGADCSGLGE